MTESAAGSPVRAVLLAHPAGHSLSPVMHDAAFDAAGIAGRYVAWDVAPDDLAGALLRVRTDPDLLGANVTVPHKRAATGLVDARTPAAERLGAVNTLVKRDGALIGDNTDLAGFRASLDEAGVALGGVDAVVLGAGGAALAVVAALLDAGALVAVHNRTRERAEALADALAGASDAAMGAGAAVLDDGELAAAVRSCRLLVNATSVGMQGGPPGSPLAHGVLPAAGTVVDLVYRPRRTPLLAAAAAAGLATQDGLAMLVHQGARAFEAWTAVPAPVEAMRRAVESISGR